MIRYWFSCSQFTVQVNVHGGVIVNAAPIVRRFKGQPLDNLIMYATRLCHGQPPRFEEL